MLPSALPLISQTDYAVFQRMIPELDQIPYDEWSDDHVKAVAYRKSRNGSQEIAISPQEFEMWLKHHQVEAHLELLWACVEDKAKQPVSAMS
jgi:hypothetical protein